MATGPSVLDSLGPGTVRVLHRGPGVEVSDIHLAGEGSVLPDGALVVDLVDPREDRRPAVRAWAHAGAAAVVLRGPVEDQVVAAAVEADLTAAELDPRMGSSHFIWLLHMVVNGTGREFSDAATAQQDLFGLADTIGALLEASVTIEDARSRVVAYSSSRGPTDPARTSTILGRAVPPDVVRRLRASGVLKRVTTSGTAFVVPAEPDFRQRLVVPVRVGTESIGSIWAIWDGRLNDGLTAQLDRVAAAVAVHLVRLRAQAEQLARYSVDAVRQALRGDAGGSATTPFTPPQPVFRVVALQPLGSATAFDDLSVWRTYLRRHSWAEPILADVDGQAFAIVGDDAAAGSWRWLRTLCETQPLGSVAGSRPTRDVAALPTRRSEATEVLQRAAGPGVTAADYEDLWASIVLDRAVSSLSTSDCDQVHEFLTTDAEYGSDLAVTLATWWECHGDVHRSAQRLHVHPNTVRHRVRRAREALAGVDLDHPDQWLATLLLLRLGNAGGR